MFTMNRFAHRALMISCCLVALGMWLVASPAAADLVEIDFRDQNLPTSPFPDAGGPHWRGVVDTLADTLTIHFWEEIPGSTQYWVPSLAAGPLVWSAVDSTGQRHDVPDDFGASPKIGTTWGFLSPLSAREMVWEQGSFLLPASADFYPGWGAVRRPLTGVNPVQMIYDMTASERTMPLLPYNSLGIRAALDAQVRVTGVTVTAVPEPSAFALGGLISLGAGAYVGFQRRLGAQKAA